MEAARVRVWLIKSGEPLAIDPGMTRLHRMGTLANLLAERGHEVVLWTSTFDHYHKRQRAENDTHVTLSNGVQLYLLRGCGYRRNVSVARVREHRMVAKRFMQHAEREELPDIILCAFPTLESSVAATAFGKANGVPVVVDIRDLWPDLFLDLVPRWSRPIARLLLTPMWQQARRACRDATAISGTSRQFVEWGLRLAQRERTELDRDFPFGYFSAPPSPDHMSDAQRFWAEHGVHADDSEFTICFFGALGRQFELDAVVRAARLLKQRGANVRFILCGAGENLERLRALAADLPSVQLPGWVSAPQIWALMRMSDAGLAPYLDKAGFSANFPNKTIEYLSAGLPVVSSLRGEFHDFLQKARCGVTYDAQDAVALADTLEALAADPERVRAMSQAGAAIFEERFVAERVYTSMIDYLEHVASRHS